MQPRRPAELAPVEVRVEALQQPHIAERVEPDAAGDHEPLAAVATMRCSMM